MASSSSHAPSTLTIEVAHVGVREGSVSPIPRRRVLRSPPPSFASTTARRSTRSPPARGRSRSPRMSRRKGSPQPSPPPLRGAAGGRRSRSLSPSAWQVKYEKVKALYNTAKESALAQERAGHEMEKYAKLYKKELLAAQAEMKELRGRYETDKADWLRIQANYEALLTSYRQGWDQLSTGATGAAGSHHYSASSVPPLTRGPGSFDSPAASAYYTYCH